MVAMENKNGEMMLGNFAAAALSHAGDEIDLNEAADSFEGVEDGAFENVERAEESFDEEEDFDDMDLDDTDEDGTEEDESVLGEIING